MSAQEEHQPSHLDSALQEIQNAKGKKFGRRSFIKMIGAAGAGLVFGGKVVAQDENPAPGEKIATVPTQTSAETGVQGEFAEVLGADTEVLSSVGTEFILNGQRYQYTVDSAIPGLTWESVDAAVFEELLAAFRPFTKGGEFVEDFHFSLPPFIKGIREIWRHTSEEADFTRRHIETFGLEPKTAANGYPDTKKPRYVFVIPPSLESSVSSDGTLELNFFVDYPGVIEDWVENGVSRINAKLGFEVESWQIAIYALFKTIEGETNFKLDDSFNKSVTPLVQIPNALEFRKIE